MQLGYVVVFVPDVEAAVRFYERAFGLERAFVTPQFGQMKTGATSLAFGAYDNERSELGDAATFRDHDPNGPAAGVQVSLVAEDVAAAYERAVAAGATPVVPPTRQPWGQLVSRVRDCHGVLVSIVSARQ